jgi:acyl-CoA synthetase (AMP-forming)/AMP-acid ligase II
VIDQVGPSYARRALELFAGYGDAEALVGADGRRITYAEAHRGVLATAVWLWEQGLRPGDGIVALVTNPPESIYLQLAAHLIGCRTAWIASNAPPRFRQRFVRLAQVKAFIYETEYFIEMGKELAEANPTLQVFCIGPGGLGQDIGTLPAVTELPFDPAAVTEEPQSLFQTGGTTGEPKLVHHRQRFFDTLLSLSEEYLRSGEPPLRHLLIAGTWHVSSQTAAFMTLFTGGTLFLQVGMDNAKFLRAIEQEQINSTMVVPPMLYALLEDPMLAESDCSSLHTFTIAGSAASPARLARAIERFGPVIRVVYGMSESPFISALPNLTYDPAAPDRLASCGVPYGDVKVEIRGEDGATVPVGEVGEVYISGSLQMAGYWGRPDLTAETIVDGWVRTGDAGRVDEEGYLYLVDRIKDMVVTGIGSTNVYCRPIEDTLASHPQVRGAAIIGVPDQQMGEVPHAFVITTPGAIVTAEELRAYAVTQLNAHYSPRSVDFVDAFPLTGSGKVDKKALREWYTAKTRIKSGD